MLAAARARSGSERDGAIASPVHVHLLRPGDSLRFQGERLQRLRSPPYAWPARWGSDPGAAPSPARGNEAWA